MLSVFMLSVFMLSVFMLSVFMVSVFMLSVIMLSVLAPQEHLQRRNNLTEELKDAVKTRKTPLKTCLHVRLGSAFS
jgi:hypothetical protein